MSWATIVNHQTYSCILGSGLMWTDCLSNWSR